MTLKRRNFINLSARTIAAGAFVGMSSFTKRGDTLSPVAPFGFGDVEPITVKEREARVEKAQRLMTEQKIGGLVLESGTSLGYFTGISWWPSERTMVAIIPAKGSVTYVCPAFEEARFRELITIGKEVRAWQEDESPYKLIAAVFKDLGITSGNIGIEERVRFFIMDGIRKEAAHLNYISGDSITIPCRMIKSPAEIALMQRASDITVEGIKAGIAALTEGMTPHELSAVIGAAQRKLGGDADGALVLFGQASAFPHGTRQPQKLKKGDIVLMDCGCGVQDYASDITRTVVFGDEPTKRQLQIWNLEKQSQDAGFNAAKLGYACENVDAAARKVITDGGFGPGYQLPGLPHRTGHGIGLDGHEWGNMVKGNKQILQTGMCFSVEPTISIPGEFGVRLEDCAYMTNEGPKWFSPVAKSISQPFG
jgi:Xaa-Pro dipeptidase